MNIESIKCFFHSAGNVHNKLNFYLPFLHVVCVAAGSFYTCVNVVYFFSIQLSCLLLFMCQSRSETGKLINFKLCIFWIYKTNDLLLDTPYNFSTSDDLKSLRVYPYLTNHATSETSS